MNKIDLSPQQVQQAAQAGVTLLNTPGAVNVPGPMSISGITGVLHAVLLGIAENKLIVVELAKKPAEAGKEAEPNKQVADAVAAAAESSGNSEKPPSVKEVEGQGGKQS